MGLIKGVRRVVLEGSAIISCSAMADDMPSTAQVVEAVTNAEGAILLVEVLTFKKVSIGVTNAQSSVI